MERTSEGRSDVEPLTMSVQRILCCPETRDPLVLVTAEDARRRCEAAGASVPEGCTGGFVSETAGRLYPIFGEVMSFLDVDSISIGPARSGEGPLGTATDTATRDSVRTWYDDFGWQRNPSGVYNDTALFSQTGATAHSFYEVSSHLGLLDRYLGGEFLLDAASGPLAHPEYLAYSWTYQWRVCVDVSITALRGAARKLGPHGFYCRADISRLPFRSESFDGIISGYTIQHISEADQAPAVAELFRVLRPGHHLVILTEVLTARGHALVLFAMRVIRKLRKLMMGQREVVQATPGSARVPGPLYYFKRRRGWWKALAISLTPVFRVESLRILTKAEFQALCGESIRWARLLRLCETLCPRLTSHVCAYVAVTLVKPLPRRRQ